MVDVRKQTQEFIDEYGCSYLLAWQAATLSKDLCETYSQDNLAVNLALASWGLEKNSFSIQVLKACAIAVLRFTDYYYEKQAGKTHDENTLPSLSKNIYPIVAIVIEKPKAYVPIYVRALCKNFSTHPTVKELIFALVDEALQFM